MVDYNDGNNTSYDYDSRGNRTDVNESGSTTTYLSNNLNQYTKVGAADYTYTENGSLVNFPFGGFEYLYYWDNKLGAIWAGTLWHRWIYDYAGKLVTEVHQGTARKYCHDGEQVISEYDNSGTLLRKFVYGPGIDEPICMIDVADNNAVYYYHRDGLGSVVAISDANADIVEEYSYDVYGLATITDEDGDKISYSNIGNPYMFTGRRYNSQSGLYYYRARHYDPETGRFIQPDPIGYFDSMNLYGYCGDNPINCVDPMGLSWYHRPWIARAAGAVGNAAGFVVCPAGHTYFEVKVLYGPDSGNH